MNSDLFIYPQKLPEPIAEVPMYRTMIHRTYSRRLQAASEEFNNRLQIYSRLFNTKSEPQDKSSVILFREPDYTLEVYRPSDSLRWSHRELAYREHVPAEAELPKEQEARELATNFLREYRLENNYAQFQSVAYSQLAISTSPDEEPTVYNTEAHVLYNFNLEGYPVFGPGAKIKASFVEGGRMSRFLNFWRTPTKEKTISLISPEEALKKFSNDPRFMRISPDTAVVNIHDIQFGYYTLPPTEFQRYLIPVYAVSGTVKTQDFERYDFTHYVVAVELTKEQIKQAGVVANPASCTVF